MDRLYIPIQIHLKRIKFKYNNIIKNYALESCLAVQEPQSQFSHSNFARFRSRCSNFSREFLLCVPSAFFVLLLIRCIFSHSSNMIMRDLRIQVSCISATSSGLLLATLRKRCCFHFHRPAFLKTT